MTFLLTWCFSDLDVQPSNIVVWKAEDFWLDPRSLRWIKADGNGFSFYCGNFQQSQCGWRCEAIIVSINRIPHSSKLQNANLENAYGGSTVICDRSMLSMHSWYANTFISDLCIANLSVGTTKLTENLSRVRRLVQKIAFTKYPLLMIICSLVFFGLSHYLNMSH